MITAPLDKLTGSTQQQDIAKSRGPQDVFRDCYRVKEYVKWEDVEPYTHPGTWEFPQPFQVASEFTHDSWSIANRVFLGQLSDCNLSCDYCYRGTGGETVDVTPEEYVQAYLDYNKQFRGNEAGVLRVSGGEPFLYQDWVAGVIQKSNECGPRSPFVWVDTNLTIRPSMNLLMQLIGTLNTGINGCFKPNLWSLQDQLSIARGLVANFKNCYFYWPSDDGLSINAFPEFLEELGLAIPLAPLRLTVINIKYRYETVREKNSQDWEQRAEYSEENFAIRRRQWHEWCQGHYHAALVNMPSHQVFIG